MNKFLLSFLAGALSMGVAVFASQGHTAVLMFGLGAVTVVGLAVAMLRSPERLRTAANVLEAIADGLQARSKASPSKVASITPKPVSAPLSAVATDVADALVNCGAKRKDAEQAARKAEASTPSGKFEDVFKSALALAKAA